MIEIENPILPGFNADPSAIRVGEYYYVVTSTFNWAAGVALYRSKDLKNWKLIKNILDRQDQLDLRGNPDSCGIWAPQISYNPQTDLFYLAYTDVKSLSGSFFDLNNYVVVASNIEGIWSDPYYLNSSGFDPSLFHDEDGRSWLLNLAWEFRGGYPHPGPIIIQEYNIEEMDFVGEASVIYTGNPKFGCTEGPHLLKRDGYYYLITAEGGTGYGHAVKIARSDNVQGPYVESPYGPLITSRENIDPELTKEDTDFLKPQFYNPNLPIQKAGHGSIVDTLNGESVLFHLSSRPVMPQMRCTLNRETSLQKIIWEDGWPKLANGGHHPDVKVQFSHNEDAIFDVTEPGKFNFYSDKLSPQFYSLKNHPQNSWCSLTRKSESLSIKGRNSPYSAHDFSSISRRIQHFNCDIECEMFFEPENPRHMAGLILQTGSRTFYFLRYYYSETLQSPALGILISLNGEMSEEGRIELPVSGIITLKAELRTDKLFFKYKSEKEGFKSVGVSYDATVLSDEYTNNGPGAFDGTFAGMCACDMDKQSNWAEFNSFTYTPL